MVTWVYDEFGCASAILDDFCIRNLAGHTVGWVFGLSVFSLKGEHIGWYEEGVFFDIDNAVLGLIPGASGLRLEPPALALEPSLPAFHKRPHVPALRGRVARPSAKGWSAICPAAYFAMSDIGAPRAMYLPRMAGALRPAGGDFAH